MKRCPVCLVAPVAKSQRMCSTCRTGLAKYPAENPEMVAAYVALGLLELARYLEPWAAFDLYLHEKEIT